MHRVNCSLPLAGRMLATVVDEDLVCSAVLGAHIPESAVHRPNHLHGNLLSSCCAVAVGMPVLVAS